MEGGPTTPAHFNSVACVHTLRQEVDLCDASMEQHYAAKFCFKLGKSASATLKLNEQPYEDDVLSRTRVFE